MAAEGKWDELKVWQDELDGGRVVAPAEPDDLTKIAPDQIRAILAAEGGMIANMDPTTWPKQAAMAAEGKWDELKAWQDELDGGKL